MGPTADTAKRCYSPTFQLVMVFALIVTSEERGHDSTLSSCVYNNTTPTNFKEVGCSTLDLRCFKGTYIQIQSLWCGMSKAYMADCDESTPVNCRKAQKCCTRHPTDLSVSISQDQENTLHQHCNNKLTCSLVMEVVSVVIYPYNWHYCSVTYVCKRGRSHLSKYTNTTSSYLVHNTSLPGNRQTELLTIASPTTDSDQLESTHIPVPAIVVPVIFVTMILVIGIFLLRWRRNREKRCQNTTTGRPPFTSEQTNPDSRASNKYETIDLSTVGSHESKSYSPYRRDQVGDNFIAGFTSISTKDNVDISKVSPVAESVVNPYLELEADDIYNDINDSVKIDNKPNDSNEHMASGEEFHVLRFTNMTGKAELKQNNLDENIVDSIVDSTEETPKSRDIHCSNPLSFTGKTDNYENVKLEEPESSTNPYFILEQYDQYDHLNTGQLTEDRSESQSLSENDYNKIRFIKPAVVSDPKYGVLSHEISNGVENDVTYSHLGDSVARASMTRNHSHFEIKTEQF